MVASLRFPSCLTLGTGEAGNLEMPTGTDTKGLQAKPASSSQRTMKGTADQDRKLLGSPRLLGDGGDVTNWDIIKIREINLEEEFIDHYAIVMKVLMHISKNPSPHAYVLPKDLGILVF